MVRIVAKRCPVQIDEHADSRTGAREEQHRHRDLSREQEMMRSPALDAGGRPDRRRQARARKRQGR
jgi:hypothetical protein